MSGALWIVGEHLQKLLAIPGGGGATSPGLGTVCILGPVLLFAVGAIAWAWLREGDHDGKR